MAEIKELVQQTANEIEQIKEAADKARNEIAQLEQEIMNREEQIKQLSSQFANRSGKLAAYGELHPEVVKEVLEGKQVQQTESVQPVAQPAEVKEITEDNKADARAYEV